MHFVGLDLAWGERSPTGVAVLDEHGALVHLSAVRTDDEIDSALRPYGGDGLVAGVDAPLLVTNEAGQWAAERELGKDFRRFDAGAHPANLSNPAFNEGPAGTRGARVCARLGLDLDPSSRAHRRAVEVYPHPATITLFRLGRTLKYKNKQGRPVQQLRDELLTLIRLLESLSSRTPALLLVGYEGWRTLTFDVEAATRKAQLRVAEDQVDAVICAYVALLRERAPQDLTTYPRAIETGGRGLPRRIHRDADPAGGPEALTAPAAAGAAGRRRPRGHPPVRPPTTRRCGPPPPMRSNWWWAS